MGRFPTISLEQLQQDCRLRHSGMAPIIVSKPKHRKAKPKSKARKEAVNEPQVAEVKKVDKFVVPVKFQRHKAVYDNHKSYYGIYADMQKESLKKSG